MSNLLIHRLTTSFRQFPNLSPAPRPEPVPLHLLEKNEQDAFRVKALSFFARDNSYTPKDLLDRLSRAPITRIVDNASQEVRLTSVLLYPDKTVTLTGTFKRSSVRGNHTVPVAGSFYVSSETNSPTAADCLLNRCS